MVTNLKCALSGKGMIFLVVLFFTLSSVFLAENNANAAVKKYNLAVKIVSSDSAGKSGVSVQATATGVTVPPATTNSAGKALFKKLSAGTYQVTPTKTGFEFSPVSRSVTFAKGSKPLTTVTFEASKIPTIASLSVDNSSISVGELEHENIAVKAKDADDEGIHKKKITVTSSDESVAKVVPLYEGSDDSDSDGDARFEVEGVSEGTATLTFSSEGQTVEVQVTVTRATEAALWNSSGHGDTGAMAFNDWNDSTDKKVPANCAKCHSRSGLMDYIGADGSAVGTVENAVPIGEVIDCFACHDDAAMALTAVTFASSTKVVDSLGHEAICMICHQGRESTVSVNTALAGKEEDTPSTSISFKNIHYFAAGATLYGTQAQGGYEYTDKTYDGKFPHVSGADTCIECHNKHTLEVNLALCATCHTGATTKEALKNIRMASSSHDFDGDGNTTEGIASEIQGLQSKLLDAIKSYATTIAGTKIAYSASSYPYYFIDTNGNGVVDTDEAVSANKYNAWTPRLLKAAYNYQFSIKDPGAFAHNAKYIIELLNDSLASLGEKVTVDMTGMVRNDSGHFDATSMAYRDWDDTGKVPASCTRCHAPADGFNYYIANWANSPTDIPATYGMTCETCHTGAGFAAGNAPLKGITKVAFPKNNVEITNTTDDSSFICMTCHQGRESKQSVDDAIAAWVDTNTNGYSDTADTKPLSFKNIHYLPAGAMLYGHDALVGYEYSTKSYNSKFCHFEESAAQCMYCHKADASEHSFEPEFVSVTCGGCHTEVTGGDIETIRKIRIPDYDGDGNATEKLKDEIAGLQVALLAQMQSVATGIGKPIAYSAASYPYFFNDNNPTNGVVDTAEATSANAFKSWTPALLKASFNYQFSVKEPGAWAHNTKYMVQLLIDSIEDIGGSVTSYKRP